MLRELVATLARLEKTIPPQEESEFKTIPKNETENIQIRIVPDEDSGILPCVDIREFVDTSRYQGPTKRGIRFRWNLLPEVLACFQEQAKIMDENEQNEPSLFHPGSFVPKEKPDEKPEPNDTLSLSGLLGEDLKQFPEDFLDSSAGKGTRMKLPEAPLRLEQESTGSHQLRTEDGVFYKVRNPAEANFLIYAQMRGHREVSLPMEMIHIFRTVKAYENYLRSLRSRLFAKLLKKAHQETVASYETDKLLHSLGLPKLDT